MKAPDGSYWCDECKYKIHTERKLPVGKNLHFCDELCRAIYLTEHTIEALNDTLEALQPEYAR